jgi:alkylation response protein AidB-like acyl-CoA dehydrogenase
LFEGGEWGEDSEISLTVSAIGNYGLTSSFLGIAEAAHRQAVTMAKKRTKAPSGRPIAERPGIQRLVAETEIDLATSRALVERTGRLLDEVFVAHPALEATIDVLHEVHQQLQCTKFVVNRLAIEIVDRALTISGGSGYMQGSSLARLYRDVRAGPFMQPYSPNEVHEYVGKVALGLEPVVSC